MRNVRSSRSRPGMISARNVTFISGRAHTLAFSDCWIGLFRLRNNGIILRFRRPFSYALPYVPMAGRALQAWLLQMYARAALSAYGSIRRSSFLAVFAYGLSSPGLYQSSNRYIRRHQLVNILYNADVTRHRSNYIPLSQVS